MQSNKRGTLANTACAEHSKSSTAQAVCHRPPQEKKNHQTSTENTTTDLATWLVSPKFVIKEDATQRKGTEQQNLRKPKSSNHYRNNPWQNKIQQTRPVLHSTHKKERKVMQLEPVEYNKYKTTTSTQFKSANINKFNKD